MLFNQFSTDNWQSDQMQLDEEAHDDEDPWGYNASLEDYPSEEELHNGYIYIFADFWCDTPSDPSSFWYTKDHYWETDEVTIFEKQQKLHDQRCDCGNQVSFKIIQ